MIFSRLFFCILLCFMAFSVVPISVAQTCTSCPDTCKNRGDSCRKDIEKLTPACFVAGQKAYCDQAKKRGCQSAEVYCRAFCLVDFGSPGCPDEGGSSDGDPHQLTFDGRAYMMQAAGDFLLTQSEDQRFVVHIRQVPNGNVYSINQAIGVRLDDFVFRYDMRNGEIDITVKDEPYNGQDIVDNSFEGVSIKLLDGDILIAKPQLAAVRLSAQSGRIDVYVVMDGAQKMQGLLGDRDGNSENDLPVNDDISDFSAWLNGPYADSHRLSIAESLLPYQAGETPQTFWITPFPRNKAEFSTETVFNAEKICRANQVTNVKMGQCVYDVALTGDPSWAEGLMPIYRENVDFNNHPAAELLLLLDNAERTAGSGSFFVSPSDRAGGFWSEYELFRTQPDLRDAVLARCGTEGPGIERCHCLVDAFTDPDANIDSEKQYYLSYILTHPSSASGRSNIIEEISKYHQQASESKKSAADVNAVSGEDYRLVYNIGLRCSN